MKLYVPVASVVVVPPPKVTVAPLMALFEESITLPVTFPLLESRVMAGAVVVLPAVTVTDSEAGWNPLAEAVSVTEPAGTLLSV